MFDVFDVGRGNCALREARSTAAIIMAMGRVAVLSGVLAIAATFACGRGGNARTTADTAGQAKPGAAAAGARRAPSPEATPERVEPWPSTTPGAAWTVVEWKMTEREAREALARAGFDPQRRIDSATGRVEALDVASALNGWKATVIFDADTRAVRMITVRGDPATIAQARVERGRLEDRFGAPVETHVHWSKQCANDKAIEIEGALPAWRVTQSLTREGDAKTPVGWPSLQDVVWGMPVAAVGPAMKRAGFLPERIPAPAKKPSTAAGARSAKKSAAPPAPSKGGKLVELAFKKNDEHVRLGILEKTGLQRVAIAHDVADRKMAERRAADLLEGLGSCLSEAETESSAFRDTTAEVRFSVTGFQGQRVVFESYRNPAGDLTKLR